MHAVININLIAPDMFDQATINKRKGRVICTRVDKTSDAEDNKPKDKPDKGQVGGTNSKSLVDQGSDTLNNPSWIRMKNPTSWASVFDKDSNSGKKNPNLLPSIRYHTRK